MKACALFDEKKREGPFRFGSKAWTLKSKEYQQMVAAIADDLKRQEATSVAVKSHQVEAKEMLAKQNSAKRKDQMGHLREKAIATLKAKKARTSVKLVVPPPAPIDGSQAH